MSIPSSFAVIFDLDGVLIDSHNQHRESWFALAAEAGLPLDDDQFKRSFGMRNEMCIPDVFGWAQRHEADQIQQWGDRKEVLYRELLAEGGLRPLPGVVALLESLVTAGIPFGLGSSTSVKNIEVCFATTGLDRFFGQQYTGAEDVSRGKPHPDVFLEAARKLGVAPEICVVIEDAHVGVEAALAGGMQVVAVTTTHPRESFAGKGAAIVVDSLEELDADVLRKIF